MKYILFDSPSSAIPTVRIFDDITSHVDVRNEVLSSKPGLIVLSAGEIWFHYINGCLCYHKSVSLDLPFDGKKSEEATNIITLIMQQKRLTTT